MTSVTTFWNIEMHTTKESFKDWHIQLVWKANGVNMRETLNKCVKRLHFSYICQANIQLKLIQFSTKYSFFLLSFFFFFILFNFFFFFQSLKPLKFKNMWNGIKKLKSNFSFFIKMAKLRVFCYFFLRDNKHAGIIIPNYLVSKLTFWTSIEFIKTKPILEHFSKYVLANC